MAIDFACGGEIWGKSWNDPICPEKSLRRSAHRIKCSKAWIWTLKEDWMEVGIQCGWDSGPLLHPRLPHSHLSAPTRAPFYRNHGFILPKWLLESKDAKLKIRQGLERKCAPSVLRFPQRSPREPEAGWSPPSQSRQGRETGGITDQRRHRSSLLGFRHLPVWEPCNPVTGCLCLRLLPRGMMIAPTSGRSPRCELTHRRPWKQRPT